MQRNDLDGGSHEAIDESDLDPLVGPSVSTRFSGSLANAVRFFASDRASYLTGEILHVHGGGDRMTFGGGRRT